MTSLGSMIKTDSKKIKNATHLDLINAVHEIDFGATNWLHGREAQSNLHGALSHVRAEIAGELCERLDLERIDMFPCTGREDGPKINGKSLYDYCKELDESQVVLPQTYFALVLEDVAKANNCEISDVRKHIEDLEEKGFTFKHWKDGEVSFKPEDNDWEYPSYWCSEHHRNVSYEYDNLREAALEQARKDRENENAA